MICFTVIFLHKKQNDVKNNDILKLETIIFLYNQLSSKSSIFLRKIPFFGINVKFLLYIFTHGTILTMHTEGSIHETWGVVKIVPVWRWLIVKSYSK